MNKTDYLKTLTEATKVVVAFAQLTETFLQEQGKDDEAFEVYKSSVRLAGKMFNLQKRIEQ